MDEAQQEVKAFSVSLDALSSYEKCTAGHADLVSAYTKTMMSMRRSHRQLRQTWHEASNIFGELAAVITDAEVLAIFVREEGCSSSLLDQTASQVAVAVESFAMLA